MLMMYIMVLIKEGLCEIIFVAPILARLVPSFHHHFLCTSRDTVTIYLLKTVGQLPMILGLSSVNRGDNVH